VLQITPVALVGDLGTFAGVNEIELERPRFRHCRCGERQECEQGKQPAGKELESHGRSPPPKDLIAGQCSQPILPNWLQTELPDPHPASLTLLQPRLKPKYGQTMAMPVLHAGYAGMVNEMQTQHFQPSCRTG